jgi:hypothetical protein
VRGRREPIQQCGTHAVTSELNGNAFHVSSFLLIAAVTSALYVVLGQWMPAAGGHE